MKAETQPSPSIKVTPLLWLAPPVALVQLGTVILSDRLDSGALDFARAILSCIVLPLAGQLLALVILGRGQGRARDARGTIGAFALVATSLGCGLVLHFLLAVVIRGFWPPIQGYQLSLATVAVCAPGPLLAGRLEGLRIRLEPGLSPWALALGLAVAIVFAIAAYPRLFGGMQRFVVVPHDQTRRFGSQGLARPGPFPLEFTSGVREDGQHRFTVTGRAASFMLSSSGTRTTRSRVAFVVRGAPTTHAALWRVPNEVCHKPGATWREQRLAEATVPDKVSGFSVAPVAPRSNALLLSAVDLDPGVNCFQLRLSREEHRPPLQAVELIDLTHQNLNERVFMDGRLFFFSEKEFECHISDALYHLELQRSNHIQPFLLLWGCFTQTLVEVMAGDRDLANGILFLFLALLCFAASLVMMGAVAANLQPARGHLLSLLLLGPFISHLYGLVYVPVQSFSFPDTPYSFLLLGALALLLRRERVGFILLGCLAAFARYPGAYVLAAALIGRLLYVKEDRAWTRRTLLYAVISGVVVAVALLVYFDANIGVIPFVKGIYFEVVPEHFGVGALHPLPAWVRILLFFIKLALLSSLTITLWPLVRRAAGKVLILVTLAYILPLMAVHAAHTHYFPVLLYLTAAAGVGALANRCSRALDLSAAALVLVGTYLGAHQQWLDRLGYLLLRT